MAWASFNDDIEVIKQALEGDDELEAFCLASFKRKLTVRRSFEKRTEIDSDEFPIMLIVRPSMDRSRATGGLVHRNHKLLLFFGFREEDKSEAQSHLVIMEELVEQALDKLEDDPDLSGEMLIEPGDSANDQGHYHPVYFIAKEVSVLTEREV